jgi:hypothetical protein
MLGLLLGVKGIIILGCLQFAGSLIECLVKEAVMIYVVCKFWPDQSFSSKRRMSAAGRSREQMRSPVSPVLASPPAVSVLMPPDMPKKAA